MYLSRHIIGRLLWVLQEKWPWYKWPWYIASVPYLKNNYNKYNIISRNRYEIIGSISWTSTLAINIKMNSPLVLIKSHWFDWTNNAGINVIEISTYNSADVVLIYSNSINTKHWGLFLKIEAANIITFTLGILSLVTWSRWLIVLVRV